MFDIVSQSVNYRRLIRIPARLADQTQDLILAASSNFRQVWIGHEEHTFL
jgi:hypothetical protein